MMVTNGRVAALLAIGRLVAMLSIRTVVAFTPPQQMQMHVTETLTRNRNRSHSATTTTAMKLGGGGGLIAETSESARSIFYIWFFGASGGAGLAVGSFPRMYRSFQQTRSLQGQGPTLGGEMLGLSPLLGYPSDVSIADVSSIVSNPLSVEQIVEKYPIANNFLSAGGYLTYAAFCAANSEANPLAVRAVFDTFSQSTNAVEPKKAQDMINAYKENVGLVKDNLWVSKATSLAAISVLSFLLLLASGVSLGNAYKGWFPDWPGGTNFPACLLDPETGPWTIPDYWI
jgi:hypothetical protein